MCFRLWVLVENTRGLVKFNRENLNRNRNIQATWLRLKESMSRHCVCILNSKTLQHQYFGWVSFFYLYRNTNITNTFFFCLDLSTRCSIFFSFRFFLFNFLFKFYSAKVLGTNLRHCRLFNQTLVFIEMCMFYFNIHTCGSAVIQKCRG